MFAWPRPAKRPSAVPPSQAWGGAASTDQEKGSESRNWASRSRVTRFISRRWSSGAGTLSTRLSEANRPMASFRRGRARALATRKSTRSLRQLSGRRMVASRRSSPSSLREKVRLRSRMSCRAARTKATEVSMPMAKSQRSVISKANRPTAPPASRAMPACGRIIPAQVA